MSIFFDLCTTIDIYNSRKKMNAKKTLKNYFKTKSEEKSLIKIINRATIDAKVLKNSFIEDFIYTFYASSNSIDIKNITCGFNEDTKILWFKFTNRNSELSLTTIYGNSYKITVRFEDTNPGSYPIMFSVFDNFTYDGIDTKRKSIIEYANEVIRTFIKQYCIIRMNK